MFTSAQIAALQSTLSDDLRQFLPELIVVSGIVLFLLIRLFKAFDRTHLGGPAIAVLGAALAVAAYSFDQTSGTLRSTSFFGQMIGADTFAGFARTLVLAAALLTVVLTRLTGIPDRLDSGDFYTLLLGSTLGMLLMVSANHLLMVFIGVEMASLPSYAMAGFLKGRRKGSEAALKYVVFGAAASGVMLYGISLLAGTFGTGFLPDVMAAAARRLGTHHGFDPLFLTGITLLFVGLGFKLAAVPFHFWCPDVFEGAAAEVAGFLSVASKAAAVVLTLRIVLTLQGALAADPATGPGGAFFLPETVGIAIGIVGAVTVTLGNLAAFGQTNLKRLLAYSTIAHAGYMMLGIAALTSAAASAVLYYLVAYLFMNLGAFAVVALIRNATGSEELSAARGLVWRSPVLAVTMALFLFSLLGFPPLAGFAGKFQVFAAVYQAGREASAANHPVLGSALTVFLAIGAINTALSAYYYLRIVREMLLEGDPTATTTAIRNPAASAYLTFMAAVLVALGVVWNPLVGATERAVGAFKLTGLAQSTRTGGG